MSSIRLLLLGSLMAACASATGGSDNAEPADASTVAPPPDATAWADAAPQADGPIQVTIDAAVMGTPDAANMGFFCDSNSDCTNAGECCLPLVDVCGAGTVQAGFCIPE